MALPVIAANQLGLGSAGYGLLLGALGVGAVLGAFVLSGLRIRFGQNVLLTAGAAGFAVATAVLALVPNFAAVLAALGSWGMGFLVAALSGYIAFGLAGDERCDVSFSDGD